MSQKHAEVIGGKFMISLTCTNCQSVLTIDDAFAGGVCRCQHCGTIQTVPSRLKQTARAAEPQKAHSGKTLYQKKTRPEQGSSTGLEELAEVVASSGISSSGLTSDRMRGKPKGSAAPSSRNRLPVIAVLCIALLALIGVVIWLMMVSSSPNTMRGTSSDSANVAINLDSQAPAAPTGPSFCDVKLDGSVVIYVLDRGNGTRDYFDTLKEVTYKSIESLGSDRKFQVIFWDNGRLEGYPAGLPAYARPENLTACRRAMEDVTAFGQSDAMPALTKAFANHADVVILATGKALELDAAFIDQVMGVRKSANTKIDTFALGDASSPGLKVLATRTNGEYRTVSTTALRGFAE